MRTRTRLLEAARARFAQQGPEATTIQDITEAADLGKGTFYRHFADKNDVLSALVQEALEGLNRRIRGDGQCSVSLEAALDHLVNAHAAFIRDSSQDFALLFGGSLALGLAGDCPPDHPLAGYLAEIGQRLRPHLAGLADGPRVRKLAYVLSQFALGLYAFSLLGLGREELERATEPARRSFVAGAAAFLNPTRLAAVEPLSGQPRPHIV